MFTFDSFKKFKGAKTVVFLFEAGTLYLGLVAVTGNIICPTVCIGPSMIPTVNTKGELALVDVYHYKYGGRKFERGDVVIAKTKEGKKICKRIRALEGDIVYNRISATSIEKIVLRKGQVWLQGDNPSNSMDSRMYGPLTLDCIDGKVWIKIDYNNGFATEILEKDFQYQSVEDERNDTKILKGGACLENGDYVDCNTIDDIKLPQGEFPDPTPIMKKIFMGTKPVPTKEDAAKNDTRNDDNNTASSSHDNNSDTISSPSPSSSLAATRNQSGPADCESMVFAYHRQKKLGPAVIFDKGEVVAYTADTTPAASTAVAVLHDHKSTFFIGNSLVSTTSLSSSSSSSSAPANTTAQRNPNELKALFENAKRQHEEKNPSIIAHVLSTLFRK